MSSLETGNLPQLNILEIMSRQFNSKNVNYQILTPDEERLLESMPQLEYLSLPNVSLSAKQHDKLRDNNNIKILYLYFDEVLLEKLHCYPQLEKLVLEFHAHQGSLTQANRFT